MGVNILMYKFGETQTSDNSTIDYYGAEKSFSYLITRLDCVSIPGPVSTDRGMPLNDNIWPVFPHKTQNKAKQQQ